MHRVKKGLDLPIAGEPLQEVSGARPARRIALLPADYLGLRARPAVEVGDTVQRGQALMEDRKRPLVRLTAPGSGRVVAVHRGLRRALESVVIDLDPNEEERGAIAFDAYRGARVHDLTREHVQALLLESGLWTALRTRPFSHVPDPDGEPSAIFVTAMDTHPLSPTVEVAIAGRQADLSTGLSALTKLTAGKTYLCTAKGSTLEVEDSGAQVEQFDGPHPAGTVGLHIHRLCPVDQARTVWHVGAQDVVAIGHLLRTGELDLSRVVSLAGPSVERPRLLRTRIGASVDALVEGELRGTGPHRVLSGSVLSGRPAMGEVHGYLGRYHQQISVLAEGTERRFLGWMAPGTSSFSILPLFLSVLWPRQRFPQTTATFGGPRAMVPIGTYERVMPMDILPSHLLRALVVGDVETAIELGCLELDEEDLDLCSFVCPGKAEYGPLLREVLNEIEAQA